jgi:protein involved in polysaccharide export with SLBB domain
MKTILKSAAVVVGSLILAGCASPEFQPIAQPRAAVQPVSVASPLDPSLLRPESAEMTLGPGDVIDVELLSQPGSRATLSIGPDGKIYYDLAPGIDVWGLTLKECKARLEKELASFHGTPRVAVTLRAVGSKQVWMLGRMKKPGVYPMTGPVTLLEALAQAGGPARTDSQTTTEELSDLRHSFIVRDGQMLPVNFDRLLRGGDMSQNIYLRAGDFVYLPFAGNREVYVMGAVRFPRALPFNGQMSLVTAIAGASGTISYDLLDRNDSGVTTANADLSHVAVVRGSLANPQVFILNYNDIIKGKAADFPLEPGDIVHVPNSPYTSLKRYVNLILNSFSATVAANEGVRAGGGTVNVGVSVPVGQ